MLKETLEEKGNRDILIAGETVKPGQQKLLHINIDRLPTGTLIDIPVYVYNSKKPGPNILVQAGLHGDEINGIEIVRRMMQQKFFRVSKGAVIAVPILNVFGFIHFSRDVPDGKDVNRSFPGKKSGSMASRIAYHYLTEVLSQADFGIDLHTGGAQRNNFPQTRYTEEDSMSVTLSELFAAPFRFPARLIRGSFRNAAFRMGKPSIVYEAGESMRFDEGAIAGGIAGILRILNHFEMLSGAAIPQTSKNKPLTLSDRRWMRAPTAGMFIPEVTNGNSVKKGQEMGLITDTYAKHRKLIKAPFDGYVICINHQAVVNQGDALFHIGR